MSTAGLLGLANLLTGSRILTGDDTWAYRQDASVSDAPQPLAVIIAGNAEDVSVAIAWASAAGVSVVPRGAGTGVVGGASSMESCVVISTEKMNRILEIRPGDRLAVVQPGVVVDDLDQAAAEYGLMYAPDPASSGTATIGGTIATNAGGLRCLRYGVTADSVASLQVALADGRLLRTGSMSRKNVVGYDLVHLFAGSEGTLGVITEATVRLHPQPVGQKLTFRVSFPSLAGAGTAASAMMRTAVAYEMLELIDQTTSVMIDGYSPGLIDPTAAATLIGQIIAVDAEEQTEQTRVLCETAGGIGFAVAADESLLTARRNALPALAANGMGVAWVASDAAVPTSRLSELLGTIKALETTSGRLISVVAHAGDGNIHAAIMADLSDSEDLRKAHHVAAIIAATAVKLGGTPTGEHGIGSLKTGLLDVALGDAARDVHRRIKCALDPLGTLNPGRAI